MDLLNKHRQYIKGTLSEEELDSFTKYLVKDYFEEEALKTRWNKILKQEHDLDSPQTNTGEASIKPLWKRKYVAPLSIAASVLFLIFAGWGYQSLMVPNYQKLLSAHLNDPHTETLSRKGNIEQLRLEAIGFYNQKEYEKAALAFQKINEIQPAVDWNFYMGLCQLYSQKHPEAIASFQQVLSSPNQFQVEAEWYLSLAYLSEGDFAAAKKHLEVVATHSTEEEAWHIKEAKEMLQAIEEHMNQ